MTRSTTTLRGVINGPYAGPETHWRYDRESRTFTREPGRRPAGYVVATPGSKSFDDPGVFRELPLVNRIRPRVKAWREAGYPGVTGTTLRLLQHWRDPELWENTRSLTPVFDSERPICSTGDMVPWYTGRPWADTERSHVNRCVLDSAWEASESSEAL